MEDKVTIMLKQLFEENKRHYQDDNEHFGAMRQRQDKLEELLKISGEHMSFIRKDLTEVKDILLEQNKHQVQTDKKLDTHIEAIQPILDKYEDSVVIDRTISRYAKTGKTVVVGLAAIITSFYVVKNFLIVFITKLFT